MQKLSILGILALLLASCSTVGLSMVEMDVVHPASFTFPAQIKKVGVVDRVDLQQMQRSDDPLFLNSRLTAQALAGNLAETEFFDDVILCDTALMWERNEESIYPLTLEHVQDLCEDLDVDMVISLERSNAKVISDIFVPWIAMETVMRVYTPNRSRPLQTIAVTDSITWDMEGMLRFEDARQDMATYMGEKMSHYIAPYWQQTARTYYDGGKPDMRDAGFFVRQNNWDKAAEIWQTAQTAATGVTREQYAYNLILYEEMTGRVEEALRQCQELVNRTVAYPDVQRQAILYQGILSQRVRELQSLNIQMQRF